MACNAKEQGLILDDVSAEYHKKIIVDDVSFSVPTEKITVLIGADGCEKSALLSTVTRILQLMDGSTLLDGKTIHEQPTKTLSRRLGILLQSPLLPEGLIVYKLVSCEHFPQQNLIRQWNDVDELVVGEALELTGTQEFTHLPVEKFFGGRYQRRWIAMVLAQKTSYILPDGPTTRSDLRYQVGILELLHDLTCHHRCTVVVVLHDPSFAVNHGDTLISLRQGRMVRVLSEGEHCAPELIKAALDVDVHASINPLTGRPRFMPFRDVEKV